MDLSAQALTLLTSLWGSLVQGALPAEQHCTHTPLCSYLNPYAGYPWRNQFLWAPCSMGGTSSEIPGAPGTEAWQLALLGSQADCSSPCVCP